MKKFKLNLKGLYGYRQSLLSRSPQPRDEREMSERRPSEERTLLALLPQRFARYAAMLIMLLTLGVGQMWAANEYNKRYLYVNSSNCSWWTDASSQPALNAYFNTDCTNDWVAFQEEASGELTSTSWYFDLSGMNGSYLYFRGFKIERHPKNTGNYWNTVTAGAENNGTHNCLWINSDGGGMTWGNYAAPISSIALAASNNILSGTGAKNDPYIVPIGKSVTLTATPTSTPADGSMSFCANFGTSPSSSPTTVQSSSTYTVSSTSKTELKCIGRNKYGDVYSADVTSSSVYVQGIEPVPGVAAAGSITTDEATLNATVTVNGATTTAYGFKYGTSSDRATLISSGTTASTSGALAANATSFSKGVSSLTANTTYYYVSFVTTASGTYYSASTQSFTTLDDSETTHEVTIYYKYSSTDIKSSTTLDVGEETPSNVSSASITGYTFSSWSLGNGLDTEDDTDDDPISITTKASGTYTLTANYSINSYSVTFNAMSGSGSMSNESFNYNQTKALTTNAYTRSGYVFKGWATSSARATAGTIDYADGANYTMGSANVTLYAVWYKKAYFVNVPKWTAANVKAHVYKDATSYKTWNSSDEVMTSTGTTIFGYTIYSYEFPENFTTVIFHNNASNQTDAWTWSSSNYYYHGASTQYASVAAIRQAWKVYGSWNMTGEDWNSNDFSSYNTGTATYTVSLAASTEYKFKYVFAGTNTWYGSGGGSMSDGDTWTLNGSNDVSFTTTIAGTYTFTIDYSGMSTNSAPDCTVDFPVTYTVTFVASPTASADAPTNNASISSGDLVLSGTSVTFTKDATPNGGYTWSHWDNNGSNVGTANTYSTTITGNTAIKAVYTENKTSITISAGANGTLTTPASLSNPYSLGVATKQAIVASPNDNYAFTGWAVTGTGAVDDASAISTNAKGDGTSGGTGTVQATFAPRWAIKGGDGADSDSDSDEMGDWGTFNGLTGSTTALKCTLSLAANTTYQFKIFDRRSADDWYGNNSAFVGQTTGLTMSTSEGNCHLTTAGAGNYIFTFNASTKELTVTYPTVTHPCGDYVYYSNPSSWSSVKAHVFTSSTPVVTWGNDPNLSSFTFDGKSYYYAALGGNTSIIFYNGSNDSEKTGDLTTASSNKGKYYSGSEWKDFKVTITLDQQSATTNSSPTSYNPIYNSTALADLSSNPAKDGYTYGGFYTAAAGGGSQIIGTDKAWKQVANYTDASKHWIKTASATIYAKWTQNITLNQNGATTNSSPTSLAATFNGNVGSVSSNPEKTGYTFGGWCSGDNGTTLVINSSGALQKNVSGWTSNEDTPKWIHAGASTLYAKWTQTVTLNSNTENHGSGDNTSATIILNATAKSSITHCTPATGYQRTGYYTAATGGTKILNADGTFAGNDITVSDVPYTSSGKWVKAGATTLYAQYKPITYTVTLEPGVGGSGDNGTLTVAYDAEEITSISHSISQTGYHIAGWYDNEAELKVFEDDGTFADDDVEGYITDGKWSKADDCTLQAWWDPNGYTVTLNQQSGTTGHSADGTVANQSVAYNTNLPTISGTAPTAANGYAFMGFYTATGGGGEKIINANLTWVASVEGYTNASSQWIHDGNVTLYAYYKKAEITGITFTDGAVVAPSTSKTVTAVISPTPTGTTTVCWRVLYSNDNPMDPQPTFSPVTAQGNSVSFTAPASSGMYKMEAVLHLGSGCGGTDISTYTANFQVAGDHEVTVQYKDASGNVIKASTTATGRPLAWSDDITAPDIFGYTFTRWDAGDGVTIKDGSGEDLTTSTSSTIKIKAVYDGRLTAVYSTNKYIYLDLSQQFGEAEWADPHVYFYTSDGYWGENGAGATGPACVGKGAMTNIDGTSIWYYDYGSVSSFGGYIAFTKDNELTQEHFYGTEAIYRGDFSEGTPVFVPHMGQVKTTTNTCDYYNAGYWVTYLGEKTGYTLRIKNNSTDALIKEVQFTSEDKRMAMKAVTDLEASHTYKFEIMRDNGKYYKNPSSMTYTSRNGDWEFRDDKSIGTIVTTASGDYTFTLSYADYITDGVGDKNYQLRVNVEYPVASNDYRLIYKDDVQTKFLTSANIANNPSGNDTVSFFVRPNDHPTLYKLKARVDGAGAISWDTTKTNLITAAMLTSPITKDSVYNFNLVMDGGGALSVGDVKGYTGNFYIRTDAANNKWDNYRASDHMMTYSEYSEKNSDYSHYFMAFVEKGTNVKCVIANDYSPCISDTMIQHTYRGGDADHVDASGFIQAAANIRFMWNKNNNAVYRAYLARGKNDGSKFLVLAGTAEDNILDPSGNALNDETNNNHKGGDHCMQFVDNENWIYEANVKIKPSSYVKLTALFHGGTFYYKGSEGEFDASHAIQLMTGEGEAELVRVIYDFKTDRLVAAWQPSGNISSEREINADVMFVREHQGDITQLTFTESGAITEIKTAYAVLRFNKWTINNKSKAVGHAVLDPLLSRYERDLFYVSFPFKVAMNEVFGFGTYGKHWIIEEYDGAARAANGFWADTPTYWRFVMDRKGKFFEPNQGYIIALDLDELGESSSVWDNGVENVELYFPSYGTMGNITNSTVTYELDAHTCTIGPRFEGGEDRRIADSHWNVMSVPTYVNTSNVDFANTAWNTANSRPNFLYEWNSNDNSLTARSSDGYTYHAMHAYMVQYSGNVTWTTSVTPASIVARRAYAEAPSEVEFRLELSQNEQMIDQTFIKLSDDEEVSTEFVFGEDMSKEFNKNKANIYTMVSTMIDGDLSITQTAGNTLPMSNQTTVIPVGVKIATSGDYTFSMPDGTNGGDVWIIDNVTGSRINLGLMDYTVNLSAGTYDGRFSLEFPIQNMPTDMETVDNGQLTVDSDVRKVFVGGRLYIIRDGKAYDATGAQVR